MILSTEDYDNVENLYDLVFGVTPGCPWFSNIHEMDSDDLDSEFYEHCACHPSYIDTFPRSRKVVRKEPRK